MISLHRRSTGTRVRIMARELAPYFLRRVVEAGRVAEFIAWSSFLDDRPAHTYRFAADIADPQRMSDLTVRTIVAVCEHVPVMRRVLITREQAAVIWPLVEDPQRHYDIMGPIPFDHAHVWDKHIPPETDAKGRPLRPRVARNPDRITSPRGARDHHGHHLISGRGRYRG